MHRSFVFFIFFMIMALPALAQLEGKIPSAEELNKQALLLLALAVVSFFASFRYVWVTLLFGFTGLLWAGVTIYKLCLSSMADQVMGEMGIGYVVTAITGNLTLPLFSLLGYLLWKKRKKAGRQ